MFIIFIKTSNKIQILIIRHFIKKKSFFDMSNENYYEMFSFMRDERQN